MALRKRTIRRLKPTARKLAHLLGGAESVTRRLKNLIDEVQGLEIQLSVETRERARIGKGE